MTGLRIRNRKPRLELGLLVLIVGFAMIIIAALNNVGQLLQNPRAPPCFPQTCPYLGFFTLLGVAGFFVALWGAIETIVAFLIQEGSLQYTPGPLPPLRLGSGPEDEKPTLYGERPSEAVQASKIRNDSKPRLVRGSALVQGTLQT